MYAIKIDIGAVKDRLVRILERIQITRIIKARISSIPYEL